MGTTYFAVFVASILAGLLVILLKSFSDSVLLGGKENRIELEELEKMSRIGESEALNAELYIRKHMLNLEQARCEKEQRRKRESRS